MSDIDWHYPRTVLARSYLATLQAGLISSIVLFAPRRTGKTEFLLEDLLPAADAAGFRTVYCSMWQNRSDPLAALAQSLAHAARPRTFGERLQRRLFSPLKKTSLDLELGPVGKQSAEAEFNSAPAPAKGALENLPDLIDAVLRASKGKVLIAFDEIQHLAKPEFIALVAALRTTLDVRKRSVKTVFTGSSRDRLQMMFSQIRAPLFQFGQSSDFPDLDHDFVAFVMHAFERATGRQVALADAIAAFADTNSTPGLFQDAVVRLMKMGGSTILAAVHSVMAAAQAGAGHVQRLQQLRPLDRQLLLMLVEQVPLYSEDARTRMAFAMGIDEAIGERQVQVALDRLVAEHIVSAAEPDRYVIVDPQFEAWLRDAHGTSGVLDELL
jgi:hypothetical protein